MKATKKLIIIIGLQLWSMTIAFSAEPAVIGTVPIDRNQNISSFPMNVNHVPEVFISRDQYLLSYNQKHRLLNWAAWKLEASDLGKIGRSNDFATDQDLEKYLNQFSQHAVTTADYFGSCFDRGHQVPSADRDDSVENNQMSFLLSNMIPQTAYLNRVIWEHFEVYTRDLILNHGKKIYIVAGPIFDQNFGKMGIKNDIPIPSKNFKVLIILNKNQNSKDINEKTKTIAVIMPNILKNGKKPYDDKKELCSHLDLSSQDGLATSPNDWQQYITTLASVEKLSGFKVLNFKKAVSAH